MKKEKNIKKVKAHQYIETEYEIEFKDILKIIENCSDEEKEQIKKILYRE